MSLSRNSFLGILFASVLVFIFSCNDNSGKAEKDEVKKIAPLEHIVDHLKKNIEQSAKNNGLLDSVRLKYISFFDSLYDVHHYEPYWSKDQQWLPLGDSLFQFIEHSKEYGLFPSDYHYYSLAFVHRIFLADTIARKNLALWAKADLLMTDAFFSLMKDVKQGRIPYDSVTLRSDSILSKKFYNDKFTRYQDSGSLTTLIRSLEPKYGGYDSIKAYLKNFLARANFAPFTYLVYPYQDSVAFFGRVQIRLQELGFLSPQQTNLDTLALREVFRKYQKAKSLKVTGRISDQMVDNLNNTDWEKFKKIAVNLDRYKQLPDTLPAARAWINLPSYYLQVFDNDTLAFQSRIIVGGPQTRTPLLTSDISNFVTYPQWTVPFSIIMKEMLPKIKQNVDFLNKENLMVVDANDSVLDPTKIKWSKLNKDYFPYHLKQREGDDNSLGVIKFNFRNKYSVYLHDTNVRWKFNNPFRAISHGCVRVKEWTKLANFLIRKDSVHHQADTLIAWIARQEKHVMSGFPKLPLYIRYFTCEGKDGRIKFYDDIYEEDRYLREKYFADKSVQ